MNRSVMSRQWRNRPGKKVGTELTLFIDPAKPTSFYCLEEEEGYFQQRLAYLIVALLVIAVLIMIGVMWLTI